MQKEESGLNFRSIFQSKHMWEKNIIFLIFFYLFIFYPIIYQINKAQVIPTWKTSNYKLKKKAIHHRNASKHPYDIDFFEVICVVLIVKSFPPHLHDFFLEGVLLCIW